MAMMGSGVGVVFELMLGRDADLWPADSSAGQAGGASGFQVHDSQVAPLSGVKYSAIEPPMSREAIRAHWHTHPLEGQALRVLALGPSGEDRRKNCARSLHKLP